MIGDGHAMTVAAEIVQHVFGATKGRFQVHHPILSMEWPQPGSESFGFRQKLQRAMKVELAVLESLLESVDERAAKNFPQHFLGKEVVVPGANPTGVIGGEAAGWRDTMDMRMSGEFLAPGSKIRIESVGKTPGSAQRLD